MKETLEKLFEGTYQYFQNGQNYSQENFHVSQVEGSGDYIFESEILSRVETGELFKMAVRYQLNKFYAPHRVEINKSLGSKIVKENFDIDHQQQILTYSFKSNANTQSIKRPFSSKHYIAAPCFVTAGLFTLTKKIDTTARTPVSFINTPNEWEFVGVPVDKIIWVEMKAHNTEELMIAGTPILASKFELHEEDALTGDARPAAELWVSKHFGIPYQLQEREGTKIVVRKLKRLKHDLEKMF